MNERQAPGGLDKNKRRWFALYTRPRFESIVNQELQRKNLESLLPVRPVIKVWSDRKKKINEPLFPSYVFVYANSKERYLSVQTRGVLKMVSFNSQPAVIPEEQMQMIHQILECGYIPERHHYLTYGDEVEVTAGPLRGLQGFVVEERGDARLVIAIAALQQSLSVEMERGLLRPTGSTKFKTKLFSNKSGMSYASRKIN